MIIECTINRIALLSEKQQKYLSDSIHVDELPLLLGREYTVYGIIFRAGFPWFLIAEDREAEYPVPHYAGFFKVLDDHIPVGWSFSWGGGPWPEGAFIPTSWSAPEFFETLLNGKLEAVKSFQEERRRLEQRP